MLHATHGRDSTTFQAVVRVTPAQVSVIGLLPMGPRAFTLDWDGAALKYDALTEAAPRPERMLADLELAFWPLAALQEAGAATGWVIREPAAGVRRVFHDGALYAEVRSGAAERWNGHVSLVNLALGYTLEIDSSALE